MRTEERNSYSILGSEAYKNIGVWGLMICKRGYRGYDYEERIIGQGVLDYEDQRADYEERGNDEMHMMRRGFGGQY